MMKVKALAPALILVFIAQIALAGALDPPGPPTAGSGMVTLQDIYDYLDSGLIPVIPGTFQEPSAGPAPTMKTTKEIYDHVKAEFDQCDAAPGDVVAGKKFFSTQSGTWGVQTGTAVLISAGVPKTGQTTAYRAGDDGALQKGVAWPSPRFTINLGAEAGTVTDNLTGLMWAKDANAPGINDWFDAIDYCNGLSLGDHDDWRLPNIKELQSLLDFGHDDPALPSGHPFDNVGTILPYWASTTKNSNSAHAWCVYIGSGHVDSYGKIDELVHVWPVRGGQ